MALVYHDLRAVPHQKCNEFYANCSYAFSRLAAVDLNQPTAIYNATSVLTPSLLEVPAMKTDLSATKITAAHHLHYNVEEALHAVSGSISRDAVGAVAKASHIEGAHQAFISGLLLWAASVSDPIARAYLRSTVFDVGTLTEWVNETKAFTVRLKPMQTHLGYNLHHLFELEVLANRGVGTVDWEAEREHRISPNVAKVDANEVYAITRAVFVDAVAGGKRYNPVDYKDYWATRWQWATLGSVHSQHPADAAYVSPEHKLKNKFYTLNSMPDLPLRHWLSRPPELHAWASVKWEWGKQRAIYGTDLTSYILFDFVMKGCEEYFPSYVPVGGTATPEHVQQQVRKLQSQGIPFCMDYEDFNSQHSVPAMQAVLRAFYDVYSASMSIDQREAFSWCFSSLEHQFVHNNIAHAPTYRATATLFSGWRLTTFVNTALNFAYATIIARRAGIRMIDRLHNGDDALIALEQPGHAFRMMAAAQALNIRVKAEKSNLASIVEFLRVDTSGGQGKQYLSRAIATLVHSRTESGLPNDLLSAADASVTRLAEAQARGMPDSIASVLRDIADRNLAQAFSVEPEIVALMRVTHRALGGISDDAVTHELGILDRTVIKSLVDIDPTQLPGVVQYASRIFKQFEGHVSRAEALRGVAAATTLALSCNKTAIKLRPVVETRLSKMRVALHRSHRVVKKDYTFGIGRLIGSLEKVAGLSANLRSLRLAIAPGDRLQEWLTILC